MTTDPLTVAVLLAVFGSGLVALTEVVSLKGAPLPKLEGAETVKVNVSELPEAMLAVAVSVALPPDCDKVNGSVPAVCVIETKAEPAGNVSERTTPWAEAGPLFVMIMV